MKANHIFLILAVSIFVLIVLFFMGNMGSLEEQSDSCEAKGGTCYDAVSCVTIERLPIPDAICSDGGVCCG